MKPENQVAINDDKLLFEPQNLTAETIKKYLCPKASDQELLLGLQIARTFKLNPLKREVYFVKYTDSEPMQVLTGYEVYLKRADRSGKYGGLKSWTTGSIETKDLVGHVKIFRKDWIEPLEHEADYFEYVQMKNVYKADRSFSHKEPNTFWKNKPKTMIKKVAESQGFRKAFPDEFDGMPYTSDEVVDQERVIDIQTGKENTATMILDEKKAPSGITHDPSEDIITTEQGTALLKLVAKNGWDKDDLKRYILFEFELGGIMHIRNKHLLKIKDYFSKAKPTKTAEKKDGPSNEPGNKPANK